MLLNSRFVRERVTLASLAVSGSVGAAAATVDIASDLGVGATVAGLTFTLPDPADLRNGTSCSVGNTNTFSYTMYGVTIASNQYATFEFHNGTWRVLAGSATSQDFWRDISQALPDGTIDYTESISHDGSVKIGGLTAQTAIAPLPTGQINNYLGLESSATERTQIMRGNNPLSYYTERQLPVVLNGWVEIGAYDISNGAHSQRISIVVSDSVFSTAKQYQISLKYDQTIGTWQTLAPIVDAGDYQLNNYELNFRVQANTVTYRIRRVQAGVVAGLARITLESLGWYLETFTELAGTGVDASVLNRFTTVICPAVKSVNADYTVVLGQDWTLFVSANAANVTVTLPSPVAAGVVCLTQPVIIKRTDNNPLFAVRVFSPSGIDAAANNNIQLGTASSMGTLTGEAAQFQWDVSAATWRIVGSF